MALFGGSSLDFYEQNDRSSMAVSTHRHKGDMSACDTVASEHSTEHSTAASDIEILSRSSSSDHEESDHEYEPIFPAAKYQEHSLMFHDCQEDLFHECVEIEVAGQKDQEPASEEQQLTEAAIQEKLDELSQMAMKMWSELRLVESARYEEDVVAPAPKVEAAPGRKVVGSKMDAKAASSVSGSSCKPSGVPAILACMKDAMLEVENVEAVGVNMGRKGTLTTIIIQLEPSLGQVVGLPEKVVAAAKTALLEAAASSETTYVLGYAASPFVDDSDGSSFDVVLADCPKSWECVACWDTYRLGPCRRPTCRRKHPGQNELQPVRVIVY